MINSSVPSRCEILHSAYWAMFLLKTPHPQWTQQEEQLVANGIYRLVWMLQSLHLWHPVTPFAWSVLPWSDWSVSLPGNATSMVAVILRVLRNLWPANWHRRWELMIVILCLKYFMSLSRVITRMENKFANISSSITRSMTFSQLWWHATDWTLCTSTSGYMLIKIAKLVTWHRQQLQLRWYGTFMPPIMRHLAFELLNICG